MSHKSNPYLQEGTSGHNMEPGKIFECKVCLEKHASLIDLEHHWAVHFKHVEVPSPMDVKVHHLSKEGSAPPKGLQVCAKCDFKTVYALGMEKHMKQVHSKNRCWKSFCEKHHCQWYKVWSCSEWLWTDNFTWVQSMQAQNHNSKKTSKAYWKIAR